MIWRVIERLGRGLLAATRNGGLPKRNESYFWCLRFMVLRHEEPSSFRTHFLIFFNRLKIESAHLCTPILHISRTYIFIRVQNLCNAKSYFATSDQFSQILGFTMTQLTTHQHRPGILSRSLYRANYSLRIMQERSSLVK